MVAAGRESLFFVMKEPELGQIAVEEDRPVNNWPAAMIGNDKDGGLER